MNTRDKKYKQTYKSGFTLAEVLVTIVILGVISAMAVPVVMRDMQRREYVVGLQRAHSILSQSIYDIARNNGYPMGDFTFFNEENFLEEFAKVVNTLKVCETTDECMGTNTQNYKQVYTQLNNSPATELASGKAVITADGFLYTFANPSGVYGLSQADVSKKLGRIVVDVNGSKSPNRYGRDTFFFYIINGKGIVPAGQYAVSDCYVGGSGRTCAAKVIKEKKMNY